MVAAHQEDSPLRKTAKARVNRVFVEEQRKFLRQQHQIEEEETVEDPVKCANRRSLPFTAAEMALDCVSAAFSTIVRSDIGQPFINLVDSTGQHKEEVSS